MDMEEPSNTAVVTDVPSGSSGIATVPVTVPPTELPSPIVIQLSSSPSSPASNVLGSSASVPASNLAGSISSSAGSNSCPDGSPQVRCLADPCAASPCLKGTLCVSNYCGGCNTQCVCPDGSSAVNCFIDPCATKTCQAGQQCVSDYCGGCTAKCVASPSNITGNSITGPSNPDGTTGPNAPSQAEQCPADKPLVDCNFNPCDNVECPGSKVCKPTYCGTCGYNCEARTSNSICPYNACSRVRCEQSAYKTVCQADPESCDYRCVALPPPLCKAGAGYSVTQRRCMPCKAGRVSSGGSNVCAACAVDHYPSRDRTSCLPCPPGYGTDGQIGLSRCNKVK
ncbi:hypothetical protein OEZ86_003693 [Tetradesmus obliquus]|nr:hypothetical protein OEZ86_003693 [Tetradesmus obliquus]